jgi:excisionase family DNA binding protein
MQDRFTVNGQQIAVIQPPTPSWRVSDVASYFGVKPNTVYKWVYQQLIPVHKTPGGRLRFIEAEVKAAQVRKAAA